VVARRFHRLLVPVVATVLLAAGLVAAPSGPVRAATLPVPPGATPLPTAQINGIAWQQVIHGNTVYVGGKFDRARPPGAAPGVSQVVRQNLLAYDITTGQLKSGFVANTNGQVLGLAMAPDGSRLYIAGEFTTVNGVSRPRIAALDPSTGAVDTAFKASTDFRVRSLVVTSSTVYAGGAFGAANGQARGQLAAFRRSDGGLLNWAPTATGGQVMAIAQIPGSSRIVAAGAFTHLNGVAARGMGAVDATSGATISSFPINTVILNSGADAAIYSLHSDSSKIYGTGYTFGSTGNFEGNFATDDTGKIIWINNMRGDQYDIFSARGMAFTVGHAHRNSDIQGGFPQDDPWTWFRAMAETSDPLSTLQPATASHNFGGRPSPIVLHWWPDLATGNVSGATQAAWSITGDNRYLTLAGEFPKVNNVAQQGIARFAFRDVQTSATGPAQSGSTWTPRVTSPAAGTAQISIPANWDYDDASLSYAVQREGAGTIATNQVPSVFHTRPIITHLVTGLAVGSAPRFRVIATDPTGRTQTSPWVAVTVSGSGSLYAYQKAVLADRAALLYRFGGSGTSVTDFAYTNTGTASSGITTGVPGAIAGDPGKAYRFNGGQSVWTTASDSPPRTVSTEAWFRTTTTTGGTIVARGDVAGPATSPNVNYVTFMGNDGKVRFGVAENSKRVITSPKAYNDGKWHHVVATLDWPGGMRLYVDGQLVVSNPNVRTGRDFRGYWRVGGDQLSGYTGRPSKDFFTGDIDEVAVYDEALSSTRVAAHYAAGTSGTVAPPPDDPPPPPPPPPPPAPSGTIAADTFGRSVTGGWGAAQTGGTWALAGSSSGYRVNGAQGEHLLSAAGANRDTSLPVAATDVTFGGTVVIDKTSTGGGVYLSLGARRNGTTSYQARVRLLANGTVQLDNQRIVSGTTTTLPGGGIQSGLSSAGGSTLAFKVQVTGSGTTTIRTKLWRSGTTEPSAWNVTATDSTAALQGPGAIYLGSYLSGSASNAPITVRWDNVLATAP
jgi:hypothetical protein